MNDDTTDKKQNAGRDSNPDPITGEPGSHPIATGVGAAGAGAAGAAIGAMAGPVGVVVGAVVGAVAGGYAGKAVGEQIDPTAEDAYWRETHGTQPYAKGSDADFDAFAPAYRTGYENYPKYAEKKTAFDDAEPELRSSYQATGATVPWDKARDATRAAWTRAERGESVRKPASK